MYDLVWNIMRLLFVRHDGFRRSWIPYSADFEPHSVLETEFGFDYLR